MMSWKKMMSPRKLKGCAISRGTLQEADRHPLVGGSNLPPYRNPLPASLKQAHGCQSAKPQAANHFVRNAIAPPFTS